MNQNNNKNKFNCDGPDRRPGVYADFMGSTPICEESLSTYIQYSQQYHANPSGMGDECVKATAEFERIRDWFLEEFDCDYIVFTSGATEANNIVIQTFNPSNIRIAVDGFRHVKSKQNGGLGFLGNIIVGETEHSSVLNPARERNGIILPHSKDINYIDDLVSEYKGPVLISQMLVNNETGAVYVEKIEEYRILKKLHPNLFLHTDAAQICGKCGGEESMMLKCKQQNKDFVTISSHKMHGPKGVGALLIKDKRALNMLSRYSFGGNQQPLVSGTINLPAIAAMQAAFKKCREEYIDDNVYDKCSKWKRHIVNLLEKEFKEDFILISKLPHVPWCVAFSILGTDSNDVVLNCRSTISNGSACKGFIEKSHVYDALGLSSEVIDGALRISYSPLTYADPINHANILAKDIIEAVKQYNINNTWKKSK